MTEDPSQLLMSENALLADENDQLLSGEAWGEMIAQHKKLTLERDALIDEVQKLRKLVSTYGEGIARLAREKEQLSNGCGAAALRTFVDAVDVAREILRNEVEQR